MPSAKARGWMYNKAEDRLEMQFNGVVVAYLDENGLTTVDDLIPATLNGVTLPVGVNGPGTDGANILTALETLGILTDTSS